LYQDIPFKSGFFIPVLAKTTISKIKG